MHHIHDLLHEPLTEKNVLAGSLSRIYQNRCTTYGSASYSQRFTKQWQTREGCKAHIALLRIISDLALNFVPFLPKACVFFARRFFGIRGSDVTHFSQVGDLATVNLEGILEYRASARPVAQSFSCTSRQPCDVLWGGVGCNGDPFPRAKHGIKAASVVSDLVESCAEI